ncbi:MAG: Hsp20/alpha crystallin family protein [Anaerolineae bacterium]
MAVSSTIEAMALDELSAAMSRSVQASLHKAPFVYEQNDCVVVEMPAPATPVDELEMRLEGPRGLVLTDTRGGFSARVLLPADVSMEDCVAYVVGGILSITFLRADAIDLMETSDAEDCSLVLAAC